MALATNHVYQGDCIKLFERIEPGSVDLVFADPPFNIGYGYDVYHDERADHEYLDWSRAWMAGAERALKADGTFWLAIGDEYAAELKLIAQRDCRLTCRSWVIWYYTFGVNCTHGFSRSHTHLFQFVKDPKQFTFNADDPAVRVPSARQLVYADTRANPKGRLPDNTWILRPQDAPHSFSAEEDTWFFRAWPARSRSGRAFTAARCRSNCWGGSSAARRTRTKSCSIRSAGAARRWRWRRSSAGNGSASSCRRITWRRSRPG